MVLLFNCSAGTAANKDASNDVVLFFLVDVAELLLPGVTYVFVGLDALFWFEDVAVLALAP